MKRCIMLLTATLILCGCAGKPTVEVIEARGSLAAARDAEADRYAVEQYDLAAANLQGALDAMAEQDETPFWARNYDLAFELLDLSMEQSQTAIGIADDIRIEVSSQAQLLIPQAQESIDSAFQELEQARRTRVVSRAQIDRLDADLGYASQLLDDAHGSFDAADYEMALDQARGALELADSVHANSEQINQLAEEVGLERQP